MMGAEWGKKGEKEERREKQRKGENVRKRGGGGGGAPQMRPVSALEDRSERKRRSAQQARALT